jgi:hypothetical protein
MDRPPQGRVVRAPQRLGEVCNGNLGILLEAAHKRLEKAAVGTHPAPGGELIQVQKWLLGLRWSPCAVGTQVCTPRGARYLGPLPVNGLVGGGAGRRPRIRRRLLFFSLHSHGSA